MRGGGGGGVGRIVIQNTYEWYETEKTPVYSRFAEKDECLTDYIKYSRTFSK